MQSKPLILHYQKFGLRTLAPAKEKRPALVGLFSSFACRDLNGSASGTNRMPGFSQKPGHKQYGQSGTPADI